LEKIKSMRSKGFETPIVIFSYLNPIFQLGYSNFASRCADSGVDGALILDLPPEEAENYIKHMRGQDIDTVFLASPTTSHKRLDLISEETRGFLYYVSRTGVTGTQEAVSESLEEEIHSLKKQVKVPIIVGFGISNTSQARQVKMLADGIVIGSAIVKIIEKNVTKSDTIGELSSFVGDISKTVRNQ